MNQRVALVTGAAGGQGRAIANRLRDKGFSVAACDRRSDELRTAVGEAGDGGMIALELDVTSPEQWDSVVAEVVGSFGSLSTLVNCAGVLHRASLADETVGGFETAWRVNCFGPFLGMRAALEHLRGRRTRRSSTFAAPARSVPFRNTPPTGRRSGRCAA